MAKAKPIELDLRRDLPKVREQLESLVAHMGDCRYTAPCAIGAMMSPDQRAFLRTVRQDGSSIAALSLMGLVTAPSDQKRDLEKFQSAFDGGSANSFRQMLAELEAKYLAEQAA